MRAIDAFLNSILDYAGLFPPAQLPLDQALANYAAYRKHPRAAMLGRFIISADLLDRPGLPDRLSVAIPGAPLPALPLGVECVESKSIFAAPDNIRVFYELNWRRDFEIGMDRLAGRPNAGVKLRCGGEAVPSAETVAQFLLTAAARRLPIKFTAGLHNALPAGGQHGFINIFCAAFAAYSGETSIESILAVRDFRFFEDHMRCVDRVFTSEKIAELRKSVVSFGSCSFLEPVESLANVGF